MWITASIKEKIYQEGYNLVAVNFLDGSQPICICAYIDKDQKIQGIMSAINFDHYYYDIVNTCKNGCLIRHEQITRAFFPEIDKKIKFFRRKFPSHFK